jgi:hypothetical protein
VPSSLDLLPDSGRAPSNSSMLNGFFFFFFFLPKFSRSRFPSNDQMLQYVKLYTVWDLEFSQWYQY